ncbi:MAG: hypothetical protein J0L92_03880 [Deltaproteobacteria bacterium]|nr:hypothetical protein [Deltaproteobacteria bacterium]
MSRPRQSPRRASSNEPPRGIAPELLVSQVKNTAPYVFDDHPDGAAIRQTPPARFVLDFAPVDEPLSHFAYFRLCLSAHYLSCATLVPTDVDNQIRHKLWVGLPVKESSLAITLDMARLVLESRRWDFLPLTTRESFGAKGSALEHTPICGHFGEWFTVAAGAYAALARFEQPEAKAARATLLDTIGEVTRLHAEVFGSLWRAKDGVGALRAAATIAHDFGDLDRVIDMWDVPITDPLRLQYRGLTLSPFDPERRLRYEGRLWAAGELYKSMIDGSSMALENHRHFALRKPRGLRSHPALRVPLGPFFDAWGDEVAARLEGEALLEVIDALVQGTERMPKTQSYTRALHAIRAAHPEHDALSAAVAKTHRAVLKRSRQEHEALWSDAALALLEDIPSRA